MDSAVDKLRQLLAIREQNRNDLTKFFKAIFGFGLALIFVWSVTTSGGYEKAAAAFSVVASVGLASTLVGGILGFLYGVPRSRSRAEPAPQNRSDIDPKSNSAAA